MIGVAMKYRTYLWIYAILVVWFTLASLRIFQRTGFWLPVFFIMVLDLAYTRDSSWRYVLAAVLMIPLIIFGCIQLYVSPADYGDRIYRVYETIPFLITFVAYQFLMRRFGPRKHREA